jgi:hypothetical protein
MICGWKLDNHWFGEGGLAAVERLHFPCRVRLSGADVFVIWYEDERNGIVRVPDGRLLVAASRASLAVEASEVGVAPEPEDQTNYDFDQVRAWCRRPTAEGVECSAFLDVWNFFDDLAGLHTASDTESARLSRAAVGCYDKLFWGNNLPSVTPPGEQFVPSWSPEELAAIGRMF